MNSTYKKTLSMFLIAAFHASSGQAMEIVAECGALHGFAKYLPNPLRPEKKDEWIEDGMSKASTVLVRFKGGFGLMGRDESNNLQPIYAQELMALRIEPKNLLFIVNFEAGNTAELYNFYSAGDKHYYALLQSRGGGLIAKNSLMTGECTTINYEALK